jgi:hypothetical protein
MLAGDGFHFPGFKSYSQLLNVFGDSSGSPNSGGYRRAGIPGNVILQALEK